MSEDLKVVLGILTLVLGGLFSMLMRHAGKLGRHQDMISQLQGRFDGVEARTELAVRRVIESHEEREDEKFDILHSKMEEVRVEIAKFGRKHDDTQK